MKRFVDSMGAALALGVPLIIGALVSLFVQWLRLRRAKLRAQRLMLPPSTEPPEPSEPWYSLRPKRKRKR